MAATFHVVMVNCRVETILDMPPRKERAPPLKRKQSVAWVRRIMEQRVQRFLAPVELTRLVKKGRVKNGGSEGEENFIFVIRQSLS